MKSTKAETRFATHRAHRWQLLALILGSAKYQCSAFILPQSHVPSTKSKESTTELFHWANRLDSRFNDSDRTIIADAASMSRRSLLSVGVASATLATLLPPLMANADFAPGGTLLDREVSPLFGNPEASPSRSRENSNVLFAQDNYYKFGAAAQWVDPPGSTDFPKTMPFVPSQQRYEALKKFGPRIQKAMSVVAEIGGKESAAEVPEQTDPVYQLRALGLLANSFLASENIGTTNELMLARWYINEMYLRIGDYRSALEKGDAKEAKLCYTYLIKASNSYLSLLNRSITSKVGDQFGYIL
mmetsp:Transcript_10092/g.24713  ORF Transcript_10092/g.24713 Transcript_10092/m.24713 type:complete len:301 (-) Transcript_10092:325-1227(-)